MSRLHYYVPKTNSPVHSLPHRPAQRRLRACSGGRAPLRCQEGIMKASLTLRSLLLAGTALGGLLASLLIVGGPAVESAAIAGAAGERPAGPLRPLCPRP